MAHPFEDLVDEVLRTSGRLVAATFTPAGGGLSGAQTLVLTAAVRAVQPPTVPQIARSLGHSRQAVQRLADTLCAKGLLETVDNPARKNARLLVPTSAGCGAYAEAEVHSREWAARVTAGISPDRLAAAVATLRELRHQLEADRPDGT